MKPPASWLNAAGWTDVVEINIGVVSGPNLDWMQECADLHGRDCGSEWRHDQRIKLDAMKAEAKSA